MHPDSGNCFFSRTFERPSVPILVGATRIAAHLLDGITPLVNRDFLVGRGDRIDVEPFGDADEIDRAIGQLMGDRAFLVRVQRLALGLSQPLEVLQQLADLAGQRHGEIFRRVERLPVPLPGEADQASIRIVQAVHDA